MSPTHIDGRAVATGGLVGGVVLAVPLVLAGARLADPYTMLAVVFAAGIPAGGFSGAVTGYTSSIGRKPVSEGAIAAVVGFCLGLSVWMVVNGSRNGLHPADTVLIHVYLLALPVMMVFPFVFFAGGIVAERTLFAK